jgi:hypothetical protein
MNESGNENLIDCVEMLEEKEGVLLIRIIESHRILYNLKITIKGMFINGCILQR